MLSTLRQGVVLALWLAVAVQVMASDGDKDEHSAEHKPLFPLDEYDKWGFSLMALMTAVAAGKRRNPRVVTELAAAAGACQCHVLCKFAVGIRSCPPSGVLSRETLNARELPRSTETLKSDVSLSCFQAGASVEVGCWCPS